MSNELRETHAKRLMEDELFQESFEATKKQLINECLHTEPLDVDRRESLHTAIHLVDRIYAHITSALETGQMAELQRNHPFI
mgnify:CR=1 FL=1